MDTRTKPSKHFLRFLFVLGSVLGLLYPRDLSRNTDQASPFNAAEEELLSQLIYIWEPSTTGKDDNREKSMAQAKLVVDDPLQTPDHRYWGASIYSQRLEAENRDVEALAYCSRFPPRARDYMYRAACIRAEPSSLHIKTQKSETLAEEVYRAYPKLAFGSTIMTYMGEQLIMSGYTAEAVRIFQKAYALTPVGDEVAMMEAKYNLGFVYINPLVPRDLQDLGLRYYHELLAWHKQKSEVPYHRNMYLWLSYNTGIAYLLNFQDYAASLPYLETARDIESLSIDSLVFRAYALAKLKRFDEAKAVLDQVPTHLSQDPQRNAFLSCYVAITHKLMGKAWNVASCLTLEDPQNDVLFDLTDILRQLGLEASQENQMWRMFYRFFNDRVKPDIQNMLTNSVTQIELEEARAESRMKDLQLSNMQLYERLSYTLAFLALILLMLAVLTFVFWKSSQKHAQEMLAEKNHIKGILDSIEEGLVRIDEGLLMRPERSAHLTALIGDFELEGRSFLELLARTSLSKDLQAKTYACLEAALGEDALSWELNLMNLPAEWMWNEIEVVCYWQPLFEEERLVSVLLAMRDVTALRRLQRHQAKTQADADRLIFYTREILAGHPKAALHFLEELPHLITQLHKALTESMDAHKALRLTHTIKGTARTIGLSHLQEEAHRLEDSLRNESPQSWMENLARLEIEGSAYVAALQTLSIKTSEETMDSLWDMVGALKDSLERQLSKAGISLEGIRLYEACHLSSEEVKVVYEVMMHALTNAADHGFVLPLQRGYAVNSAMFDIELRQERGEKILKIQDNGHGLDHVNIQKKASERGWLPPPDGDWTDFLFVDGVTTSERVTLSSGRGVGLASVREAALRMNGRVRITDASNGRGTVLIFTWPIPLDKAA